jgi:two-component system, cell cycle sensor histidine kinase and response regulator CckA
MWVVALLDVVDVNQAAVLRYGYSRDEFLAMTLDELEVRAGTERKVGGNPGVVRKHRKRDGSLIDVEVTSFAVTFGGRPALLTSALDVTYRWTTEAETRCFELMLETVTHASYAEEMCAVSMPSAVVQRRIALETNSGPLSDLR